MLLGVINVLSQVYLLGYSRKKQTGEVEDILFWAPQPPPLPPPGIFYFFTRPLKFPEKILNPWIFHKIVLNPGKFQDQKQRPLEIPHYFFLVTLGNSTLFLFDPWKFHMLFLWYPWKFHILNPPSPPIPSPPVWIFSGIVHLRVG